MEGAVVSILIVTDRDALKPTPFCAEQVSVVACVSELRTSGSHPVLDAIPLSGSLTFHVTLTVALFQPEALGDGDTVASMTGALESTTGARRACTIPAKLPT